MDVLAHCDVALNMDELFCNVLKQNHQTNILYFLKTCFWFYEGLTPESTQKILEDIRVLLKESR